jgi:ribosomal-protein-alanine N-acetyltransferase
VTIIREYKPEDFDELWHIDQQCFALGIAYSRRELAAYIRRSRAFTLVAADEAGHILGFIVAESDRTGVGHILTLDVRPTAQRTGLGTGLLLQAQTRLMHDNCSAVLLETALDNSAALSFYKRHGYSVLETIPRYYLDSVDALVMGRHLKPLPKAEKS